MFLNNTVHRVNIREICERVLIRRDACSVTNLPRPRLRPTMATNRRTTWVGAGGRLMPVACVLISANAAIKRVLFGCATNNVQLYAEVIRPPRVRRFVLPTANPTLDMLCHA